MLSSLEILTLLGASYLRSNSFMKSLCELMLTLVPSSTPTETSPLVEIFTLLLAFSI